MSPILLERMLRECGKLRERDAQEQWIYRNDSLLYFFFNFIQIYIYISPAKGDYLFTGIIHLIYHNHV